MFSRIGAAAIKKDLTNTRLLCEKLGDPQRKFKSIHVGGTNGKGSVSHMLAAVLQKSGFNTGLYTSPHLYDFRERIKVNGQMADEQFVVDFIQRIQPLADEIKPSFFELTVAMAFDYFAQKNVDVAVIEVGLGGRLDSTNIITPLLSVITNIGWDHMDLLGHTLPQIAFEKAGIIKPGVPVVIGEKNMDTDIVFTDVSKAKDSEVFFAEAGFTIERVQPGPDELTMDIYDWREEEVKSFQLGLPGIYQTKNILTVLQSIRLLRRHFKITDEAVEEGLRQVKELTGLYGRWEVIHTHPTIVLEVAHNVNGIEQMLQHLHHSSYRQLRLVLGFVRDKDISALLNLLPAEAEYYFTAAHIPRALPAEDLAKQAMQAGRRGKTFADVNLALEAARSDAEEDDLIIVCGSIFLVAEVDKNLAGLSEE